MKTLLMTFGILILLVGSLAVISFGLDSFSEPSSCKSAAEQTEKAKKLLQENKLKDGEAESLERSLSYCNKDRAEVKGNLIVSSSVTLLGLLMTIGGSFSRKKKKIIP